MVLLLGFAFLSGLVTILAPCIWPLLPIILSSSTLGKGHQRPLGITLGIMLSFAVFTLTISSLVKLLHFDPNILRTFAVVVIGFLGLTMIVPVLSRITESLVSRLSGLWGQKGQQTGSDFGAGFVTGLSLGIVWSPCAGPILAAIATLAGIGKVTLDVILVTTSYVIGVGIPLFIFAYFGQQIFTRVHFISSHTGRIQQVFGVIMLLTALAIYTNYDSVLQAKLLGAFPQFNTSINSFENNSSVSQQLDVLKGIKPSAGSVDTGGLFNINTPAPDFIGISKWLNTDKQLSIHDLKGKVVLVDFWTYTCINCIRTLPFVTSWYDKYKDQGFVVIGVHTPEFEFEKDTNNVLNAIKQYNIHYPVAQDNNFTTWNNYHNQFWPAEYLIDAKGNIRRTHFGEGEYGQSEQAIQNLLKENGVVVGSGLVNMADQTPTQKISPESYLGSDRMAYFYPNSNVGVGAQNFTLPASLPVNSFSFGGGWTITNQLAEAGVGASLDYHFFASKVFLVMRPPQGGGSVKVFVDGKLSKTLIIDSDRLYNLIDVGVSSDHLLHLEFSPGLQAFAFTFG